MAPQESVLITGCSDGGIGSALAILLQKRGFHVFATARDLSKTGSLKGLPNVTLLELDVVKPDDIKAAVVAVTKHTGGTLNYLISNAGRNHFMPILDEDLDKVRRLFEINFYGPIALTQAFAPLLIKAKGMMVYITSISGYVNVPYMGTYAASKRSLELVAETLRLELAPFGVDVLEVVTGAVKTNGQTYFGDLKLPAESLYKSIEDTFLSRAQGNDQLPRMDTMEYATAVVDNIAKRTTGRFWYGNNADAVKMSATAASVPQSAMDAGAAWGIGLDTLGK
ncbi:putative hydroxybutyrate dehydrogenase [Hypoxylon sp. FL1284]|nr:putative hydroxybutyrate dehydrogenase [Hypoxylon sp. FL1284]